MFLMLIGRGSEVVVKRPIPTQKNSKQNHVTTGYISKAVNDLYPFLFIVKCSKEQTRLRGKVFRGEKFVEE